MDCNGLDAGSEGRFAAFVELMSSILGYADRIAPFVGSHLGLRISNFVPKKPSNGVFLTSCCSVDGAEREP